MYDHLFANPLLTWLAAGLLALGAMTLVGRPGATLRLVAFNQVPCLSAAFFLIAPLSSAPPNLADTFAGLGFEFVILLLFARLFVHAYDRLQRVRDEQARSALWWTLWIQAATVAPLLGSAGFGILSEGSRIEYLSESWLLKYLTYAGLLVAGAQAAFLARRITCRGRLSGIDYAVLAANFAISFVSGSKGGVLLWLLSVAALIDYRAARIKPVSLGAAVVVVLAAAGVMFTAVADLLGLTYEEFANLALGRFLLTNDSRALAFDLRAAAGHESALLASGFRSVATLIGLPPVDPPLGNLLYQTYFDIASVNGGNASLTALLVYYMPSAYVVVPAMVTSAVAVALYGLGRRAAAGLRDEASRVAALTGALTAIQLFSQDFLAFQVLLPVLIIAVMVLWLFDRGPRLAASRHAQPAPVHRRARTQA